MKENSHQGGTVGRWGGEEERDSWPWREGTCYLVVNDLFYKLRIPGFSIAHKVTGKVTSDDCISYNVITLYINV